MGRTIAEQLDLVGVCCVEMFLTRDGKLVVNEIAPRPHNSGHLTIEACVTSQFEQQVRAICGLPLGSMQPHTPAAMVNLLGDLWEKGEPDWLEMLAVPRGYLHLYGKTEAKPGRKMGHFTVLGENAEIAARWKRWQDSHGSGRLTALTTAGDLRSHARLVPEMARAGEDHRQAVRVAGGDHFGVAF